MNVKVVLDNARAYSGGMIFGKVLLEGELDKVRAVRCVLGYEATRHSTEKVVESVVAESLPAGRQQLELPLELKVPDDAPVSYAGKSVSIEWFVEVSVDLAWASDPKDRVPVQIAARPEEIPPAEAQPLATEGSKPILKGLGVVLIAVLVAMLVPPLLMVVAVILPFVALGWFLSWLRFSSFELQVAPTEEVRLGAPILYTLAFRARRPLGVNGVWVKLTGNEVYTTGSGKTKKTHRVPFLELKHPLAAATTIPAGDFRHEGRFVLPAGSPTSILSTIEYKLEAVVDIPWWPDRTASEDLEVTPVVAEEGAEARAG